MRWVDKLKGWYFKRRTHPTMSKVYYTHWNGGRPFQVEVSGHRLTARTESYDGARDYITEVFSSDFQNIWIGDSEEEFACNIGNSILVQIDGLNYVWIGKILLRFKALDLITEFHSPIRGSDVPYPWARDQLQNTYLLDDFVVLPKNNTMLLDYPDPHHWFYDQALITTDYGYLTPRHPLHGNILDMSIFKINGKRYTCNWTINPIKQYKRMVTISKCNKISIEDSNGEEHDLSLEDYVKLMEDWMAARNWKKMEIDSSYIPPGYRWSESMDYWRTNPTTTI